MYTFPSTPEIGTTDALKKAKEELNRRCAHLNTSFNTLQHAHTSLQTKLDQANVKLQEKIKELEEASAARPRPKLASKGCQIEPGFDVAERLRKYQQIAERANYLRGQAENEQKKLTKEVQQLQGQLTKLESDKAELLQSVLDYADKAERLSEQIKIPAPTEELGVQCTLIDEIFKESRIKKVTGLPKGWPDIHHMYKESAELRGKVAQLEEAKERCSCSATSSNTRPSLQLPQQQLRLPEGLRSRTRAGTRILTARPEPPNEPEGSRVSD